MLVKQLQAERRLSILSIIDQETSVQVEDLSRRFVVSKNTIRRDLSFLEEQGDVIRSKGGAVKAQYLPRIQTFSQRLNNHYDGKKKIARRAADSIKDGELIILGSGTSIYELALNLKGREHLTIITNSFDVAQLLLEEERMNVILCGGLLDAQSRSMVALSAERFFGDIHADKLFLSVKALDAEGIYDFNMKETPVKRAMIEAAEEVIVLADKTKINRKSLSLINTLSQIDTLICDEIDSDEILIHLTSAEIEVIQTIHEAEVKSG